MNTSASGGIDRSGIATVEDVVTDFFTLPDPTFDVVEDPDGFSAELSVECALAPVQSSAVSAAVEGMPPVVEIDGQREIRGQVSVDDETLWVYVHAVGPGPYDPHAGAAARQVLEQLWDDLHRLLSES
jgi:hypothetical protein